MPLPASPVRRQKSNNKLSSFLFQLNPVFIVYFLPFIPCNRVQTMFWFRCFPQTVSLPSAFTLLLLHHTISTGRNVTYSLAQNPVAENFSQISVLRNDACRIRHQRYLTLHACHCRQKRHWMPCSDPPEFHCISIFSHTRKKSSVYPQTRIHRRFYYFQ